MVENTHIIRVELPVLGLFLGVFQHKIKQGQQIRALNHIGVIFQKPKNFLNFSRVSLSGDS